METTASLKRLARIAGVLYLINAVASGFSYGYATGTVYVPGNAVLTAQKVAANAGLVRIGVVADLFQATEWIFLAMVLYLLFRHVNEDVARALVIFVVAGAAIVCLNEVFQFGALLVASEGFYTAGLGAGANALVLLLLDLHHYGFLIAQIFFGLWLMPMGYLAYESGMFPKTLGVLLIAGGFCYLIGMLAVFLLPAVGASINLYVTIPSAVVELWMVGYLLVIGIRSPSASPTAG